MTSQEENELLKSTLEDAVYLLCSAMRVNIEKYDQDAAFEECCNKCFEDAAEIIENRMKLIK